MTIKDIAHLAGVSISTVSKIMNHKDAGISESTREKVLNIIKEYHYTPYSSHASQRSLKTLRLGLLLRSLRDAPYLSSIIRTAKANGYSVLTAEGGNSPEEELKSLTVLLSHQVDGVLWEPVNEKSLKHISYLEQSTIPFLLFNAPFFSAGFNLDFSSAGYQLTQTLLQNKHVDIAVLLDHVPYAPAFLEGYKKCLFDHAIPFDQDKVCLSASDTLIHRIAERRITGVMSASAAASFKLIHILREQHISLPHDVSLLTLGEESQDLLFHRISALAIPYDTYGYDLCREFIASIEGQQSSALPCQCEFYPLSGDTLSLPPGFHSSKILVVGSANTDNYLLMDELPVSGKTSLTSTCYSYPGGKGINQSIGAAKLGSRVSFIGAVGYDAESEVILSALQKYAVDATGVTRSRDSMTGKAYIFLNRSGDSMISVLAGSNKELSQSMITQHEGLFENTSYCLLQTEIPADTVLTAARLAHRYQANNILKPSACSHLSDEILSEIDILVPNQEEICTLCPGESTLERQAHHFLDKGVHAVIITLGAEGCLLVTKDITESFSAPDFPSVDHTGAADAFISALAVYLQRGYCLHSAIRIATYAAAFSVSREGVVPALIDQNTLEAYIRKKDPQLLDDNGDS